MSSTAPAEAGKNVAMASTPWIISCAAMTPSSLGAMGMSMARSSREPTGSCSAAPMTSAATPQSLWHATSSLMMRSRTFSAEASMTCCTSFSASVAMASTGFLARAWMSLTHSTASLTSVTWMYSAIMLLIFSSTFSPSYFAVDTAATVGVPDGGSSSGASSSSAGAACLGASALSRLALRCSASRLAFSFSVGMEDWCLAAT
mmetsp:Transcript_21446/g.53224  ORF Transcript_21446/g.53224 Transcript_21446/m.53224 type:complete len:203 (-) Transcript_21446:1153-1761(-)